MVPGHRILRSHLCGDRCCELGEYAMNIEAIRERVKVERERQRETLAWHENPKTWVSPPIPEQERAWQDRQIELGLLPF